MKRIVLIIITIILIFLMHWLLLYGENQEVFDFRNFKVIKSFIISSVAILLIGGVVFYQNRK